MKEKLKSTIDALSIFYEKFLQQNLSEFLLLAISYSNESLLSRGESNFVIHYFDLNKLYSIHSSLTSWQVDVEILYQNNILLGRNKFHL